MLKICACLWDKNIHTQSFSEGYSEVWVERLYRGFKRNLTRPFEFICFTDRLRKYSEPILQERLKAKVPDYGCLIEPFCIEGPLIVCGLDTVVLGNIDHFADYTQDADLMALPCDPYKPWRSINAIVLVPKGWRKVAQEWRGENDMEWLRRYPWNRLDALFPGEVRSLKFHKVRDYGPGAAKVIYFHGRPKPPELLHLDWIRTHWK